jgi:predicted Zn-dependent protease
MKKYRFIKPILVVVTVMLIGACASNTGPVTVRESAPAQTPDQTSPQSSLPQAESADNQTPNTGAAVTSIQPVVPDSQRNPIPLVENLVEQANRAFNFKNYQSAINLAERGLRVDRKEPRFYLVLAESYRALNNKQQSVYFAKQGLRYVKKQGVVYQQLSLLSR